MFSTKYKLRFLVAAFLFSLTLGAFAVTQKEMEQARTIAAKAYLRYANDGSGYLDDLNPTTIEELQNSLKPKEKENIKAFLAIPVPSDYAGWDKDKLIEYWGGTAFQDKGLIAKGRGGRTRAKSQISKMNIGAPEPSSPTPAPETTATAAPESEITPDLEADEGYAAADEAVPTADNAYNQDISEDDVNIGYAKSSNYTWVYIMILAILVAIIILLVFYAVKVMKKNTPDPNARASRMAREDEDYMVEKYENIIANKNYEISALQKQLDSLQRQNMDLKAKLDSVAAEISTLKYSPQGHSPNTPSMSSPQREEPISEPQYVEPQNENNRQRTNLRSIYLGRANSKGIFVRADRNLNPGHSIFMLETSDGFTGSFSVADTPAAWSLALSNPIEYLSYACVGPDWDRTDGVRKIVTETPGTAVFEGGCWKVIRKAKIRFE